MHRCAPMRCVVFRTGVQTCCFGRSGSLFSPSRPIPEEVEVLSREQGFELSMQGEVRDATLGLGFRGVP